MNPYGSQIELINKPPTWGLINHLGDVKILISLNVYGDEKCI